MACCTEFRPTETEFLACSGKSPTNDTHATLYGNDSEPGTTRYTENHTCRDLVADSEPEVGTDTRNRQDAPFCSRTPETEPFEHASIPFRRRP